MKLVVLVRRRREERRQEHHLRELQEKIKKLFLINRSKFSNAIIDNILIQIIYNINTDLQVGDKLRLIDLLGYLNGTIQAIDSNLITVELEKPITVLDNPELNGKVFVYGKEVNDFHRLNKDYLFTINFAATQELDRIIDWHTKGNDRSVSGDATSVYGNALVNRIHTLEQENSLLKQKLAENDFQIQSILQRLNNANL